MTSKHTPGPWKRHAGGGFKSITGELVPHSSPWIEGAWQDECASAASEANAHLISAAPELLAALEEMIATFECTPESARAAIKKARGGE